MIPVELGRYDRNLAHILIGRLASEGITAVAFDAGASVADVSWLLIPVRVMGLVAAGRSSLPEKRALTSHLHKN